MDIPYGDSLIGHQGFTFFKFNFRATVKEKSCDCLENYFGGGRQQWNNTG